MTAPRGGPCLGACVRRLNSIHKRNLPRMPKWQARIVSAHSARAVEQPSSRYEPLFRSAPAAADAGSALANSPAIEAVVDLMRFPALAPAIAGRPLPSDVSVVMRVAASQEASRAVAAPIGIPAEILQEAAKAYLKHALFYPGADCCRILGVTPTASREEARHHMQWLLSWLHPDKNRGWEAVYTSRVVAAWREFAASKEAPQAMAAAGHSRIIVGRRRLRRAKQVIFRVPWIATPIKTGMAIGYRRIAWSLLATIMLVLITIFSLR